MQIIIICYWRWLVCGQIMSEATTTKEKLINKKAQKQEDKIKRRLTEDNQEWNDWNFQIHQNKLEWGDSKICDEKKTYLVCPQKKCFKDDDKPSHWVGHSKLKSLNIDELFLKTPKFYENKASVTRNT